MGIDSHLSTCVDTQSPKYLEMAQRHISLSPAESVLTPVHPPAQLVTEPEFSLLETGSAGFKTDSADF
jgi:hypothetical protein